MSDKKIALIGDIVGSRQIKKRADFDERLSVALQGLNRQRSGLLSPYTVTIGDEIQALFSNAGQLFCDTVTIQAAIYPQRMRFSIGVGELVTPVNPLHAIGMDGPAFHLARDGISTLKKNNDLYIIQGETPNLVLINSSLGLVSHFMHKWSRTRLQVLEDLMHAKTVKEIAAAHGISEQAVYKNIHAGELDKVIELFQQIENALDSVIGG